MNRSLVVAAGLCALAALPHRAVAQERAAAAEQVVNGFEDEADLGRARAVGGSLALERGRAPDGEGWAAVTASADAQVVHLVLDLPEGLDPSLGEALALHVRARAPEGGRPPRLLLRALDASGASLFQRRASDALRGWSERHEPLARWRWDDRVGRWADVRAFEVVAEGAIALEVDHVRVVPGTRGARSALPDPTWLQELAFPGAGDAPWTREAGAFRLMGPASLPPDAAVERTLARLRPLSAWLDRVADGGVRPVGDGPVLVFVLADQAAYEGFFLRLGQAWRVFVTRPTGAGYAVQDLCAFAHDPERGLDRPVIVHEATHALAARRLRLMPGHALHGWVQEGLANYIQLCLHPESLDLRTWRRQFARGVDADSFFRPLRDLTSARPGLDRYAQLASVVGFLVAERPGWLGAIARGLADGRPIDDVLAELKTTLEQLQADWLAWGRATYGSPEVLEGGRHFPLPKEWTE